LSPNGREKTGVTKRRRGGEKGGEALWHNARCLGTESDRKKPKTGEKMLDFAGWGLILAP